MKTLTIEQAASINCGGKWCDLGVGTALSVGCYYAGISGLWPCIGAGLIVCGLTYLVCDYTPAER